MKQFTVGELKQYNGHGASGKIYIAVSGKVFDVTVKGRDFYGDGKYSTHYLK